MMLRRLLREALLHSHKPRRHHAALLLAASPYATATARHLLRLASESNNLMAARAWTVLMRTGDGGLCEQAIERAVVDERPTIRARALVNAGLCGRLTTDQSATIAGRYDAARAVERHATMFALGMAGAPEVERFSGYADAEASRAARWWLEQGHAIRDPDLRAPV